MKLAARVFPVFFLSVAAGYGSTYFGPVSSPNGVYQFWLDDPSALPWMTPWMSGPLGPVSFPLLWVDSAAGGAEVDDQGGAVLSYEGTSDLGIVGFDYITGVATAYDTFHYIFPDGTPYGVGVIYGYAPIVSWNGTDLIARMTNAPFGMGGPVVSFLALWGSPSGPAVVIPEPSSFVLAGLPLLAIGIYAKRRNLAGLPTGRRKAS